MPKEEALDAEFRDGLVATLEVLEEDRNSEKQKPRMPAHWSSRDLNIQGMFSRV